MHQLYSVSEIRQLEALAVQVTNVTGFKLMELAASATLRHLLLAWPGVRQLLVVCGAGNNGGDGYLLAGQAREQGLQALAVEAGTRHPVGDAARARSFALGQGVTLVREAPDESLSMPGALVVDALLGIGFHGVLRPVAAGWIDWMNATPCPVVAVDVPSGLDADTGSTADKCVRAAMTVTYIGDKRGFHTRGASDFTGQVQLADLGLPGKVFEAVTSRVQLLSWEQRQHVLDRCADGNKGRFGHTLIVGGDQGMGGAVILAAEAALRAGSGLVSLASRPEHSLPLLCRRPEVMHHPIASGDDLRKLIGRYRSIVFGPGLGQSVWSEQLYHELVQATESRDDLQVVLDADALNLLAAGAPFPQADCIMTPHPGEAARLLGVDTREVQADRFSAARRLHERFGATIVLKGAGSLIACEALGEDCIVHVCPYGNPGMSTAGMGDLLAGLLGGLLAQGLSGRRAAIIGVLAHSAAADRVALELGHAGLVAGDLLLPVARLLGGVTQP